MRQSTQVALDWITGESDQVGFQPGESIPAGAFNASHQGFTVTACEDFEDSRLQDLLRSTTLSDEDFKPRWWHNISTWYVAFVLVAAAAAFAGIRLGRVNTAIRAKPAQAREWPARRLFHFGDPAAVGSLIRRMRGQLRRRK